MKTPIYGKLLKAGRILAGLSQDQLAAEAKVERRALSRLEEDDRKRIDVELAGKIRVTLENFGIEFTEATEFVGAGVRLTIVQKDK